MTRKKNLLVEAARIVLGEEGSDKVIKGLDIIGDIAVLKMPMDLEKYKNEVAEALLEIAPYIHVVLNQTSPTTGEYRLRGLEWLAGDKRTMTIHREHGCAFNVDLSKVYFSPRLSGERGRIANSIKETSRPEVILNMFAGVGSFSIIIARKWKNVKIYSIDVNPNAVKLMLQNIFQNKVRNSVVCIFGEASMIIERFFYDKFDRVLMPLPEKAFEYLTHAIRALRPQGGIIHYQEFVHANKSEDPIKLLEGKLSSWLHSSNYNFTFLYEKVIREVAPYRFHVGFDIKIMK